MKDSEARADIRELGDKVKAIPKIHIRHCPKCKHDTIQVAGSPAYWFENYCGYDYQCLVCGSKLLCEEKTICKIVKEEK